MSEFTKKLKQAQSKWNKAKEKAKAGGGGGIDEIDDGRYLARLTNAEITESKTSGRLQVMWTYVIQEGDFKGATKFDFDGLETEDNLMFLARKVRRFGFEAPDNLEEIEAIFSDLKKSKPLCRIRLKTKGDFQNVFVDKVFDAEDEEEVLEEASSDETEDETEDVAEVEDTEETEEETEEEEEETQEEDEGSVDLVVGMRVGVEGKGNGKVLEVLEKEGKVRVRLDDGKVVRVPVDSLTAVESDEGEEEVEEEEVPPKKPVRKAKK